MSVPFLVANLISLAASSFPAPGRFELQRVVTLWPAALAACVLLRTPQRRRRFATVLSAGAVPVGLYALVQKAGWDPIAWSASSADRVFSTVGNPNMLAGYCLAVLPVSAALAFSARTRTGRGLGGTAAVLLLSSLALTESKGGLLGLGVECAAAAAMFRRELRSFACRVRGWGRARGTAAVVLLVLTVGATIVPSLRRIRRDLATFGGAAPSTSNVRLVIWRGAWRLFLAHPVLGAGPGAFAVRFPRYRDPDYETYGVTHNTLHAHSEPLEVLAELGLVGGMAWAVFVGGVATVALRRRRAGGESGTDRFHGVILCGIAGLLAQGLVSVALRWPTCGFLFWIFVGAACSAPVAGSARGTENVRRARAAGKVPGTALPAALCLAFALYGLKPYTCDGFRSEVATMAATRLMQQGRWTEARTLFARAEELNPANVRAWYNDGYCALQAGRAEAAVTVFRRLQAYSPDYCQVHYNLAVAYMNLGKWDDAAKECMIQRRIGGLPAGAEFDRIASVLARCAAGAAGPEQILSTLVSVQPGNELTRTLLGNEYFRKSRFELAAGQYAAILRKDPNCIPAVNNLAGVYFATGRYETARRLCREALAKSPDVPVLWRNLGKAYYMTGATQKAREAWQKAYELDSSCPEISELLELTREP